MTQQCKCDDCLLGITDILAEVALLNLKLQRTTSKNGAEDRTSTGDDDFSNYPQNGGDDTDSKFIRKVRKEEEK